MIITIQELSNVKIENIYQIRFSNENNFEYKKIRIRKYKLKFNQGPKEIRREINYHKKNHNKIIKEIKIR